VNRRFAFRLARVRRIRELEERLARSEWGEAQAEANQAASQRDQMRADLNAAREELRSLLGPVSDGETPKPPLDPQAVALSHELLDQQASHVRRADERTLTLQGQADRLAAAWKKRDTRRQALERLEERDQKTHFRELEREDAKEQDERASHQSDEDRG